MKGAQRTSYEFRYAQLEQEAALAAASQAFNSRFNFKFTAMSHSCAMRAISSRTSYEVGVVKEIISAYLELAASELKLHGAFKFGGCINMKLKKQSIAHKLVNPVTQKPLLKVKPVVKIQVKPLKKFISMVNRDPIEAID